VIVDPAPITRLERLDCRRALLDHAGEAVGIDGYGSTGPIELPETRMRLKLHRNTPIAPAHPRGHP